MIGEGNIVVGRGSRDVHGQRARGELDGFWVWVRDGSLWGGGLTIWKQLELGTLVELALHQGSAREHEKQWRHELDDAPVC